MSEKGHTVSILCPVVVCPSLCTAERGSAPKRGRGRHSAISFPTRCVCALAA